MKTFAGAIAVGWCDVSIDGSLAIAEDDGWEQIDESGTCQVSGFSHVIST